ncbi:MAG: hypothetical protein E6G44_07315 [Actinobacteria bacterium]|nr:MAG: hypothetical protein E6G44_07315 [Actinomycetota bacterium]
MRSLAVAALIAGVMLVGSTGSASATTGKGQLFHDGNIVRTVVNPARIPHQGSDPFYSVTNGVDGQLGIAGVAPGDGPYHGGAWAVNVVTFKEGVSPYVLTSDEAVFAAEAAGDVTVVRTPDADFRCPVQP